MRVHLYKAPWFRPDGEYSVCVLCGYVCGGVSTENGWLDVDHALSDRRYWHFPWCTPDDPRVVLAEVMTS